jgi:hypothetical protein
MRRLLHQDDISLTLFLVALLTVWPPRALLAQAIPPAPTFRIDSSLTLIDVIAENQKTGLHGRALLTDLTREDFRVFDNGSEMPIESFDIGAGHGTRPIALWLIVECNQEEPPTHHSLFLRGKTQFLKPALEHLGANDTVGVAHWCDNGDAQLDLLPGKDADAAIGKVERILAAKPSHGTNRSGELAMQSMVEKILKNANETKPRPLPVFLFLYGDHCAANVDEVNRLLTDLLETSGMVYGINDGAWPFDPHLMAPTRVARGDMQIFYLVHYYSQETGGEVYSTADPKLFSSALDYILTQLHLCYTIGFRPLQGDGKKHRLRVELTAEARKQFPAAVLRSRPEYILRAQR